MPRPRKTGNGRTMPRAENYRHPKAEVVLRPDVGTRSRGGRSADSEDSRREGHRECKERRARTEVDVEAVSELGGQSRTTIVRRADDAALHPRAPVHEGHHRNTERASSRQAGDDV